VLIFPHRSRRFSENVRCTQHLQQTFFTNRASIPQPGLTASAVITTLSKAIRLGRYQLYRVTSTLCRLRAARNRVSSSSPVMICTSSRVVLQLCASSLVFGASTENFSTTIRRSLTYQFGQDAFQRAAVHLLVNFFDCGPAGRAASRYPERQIGLLDRTRTRTAGAFWRHGFYRNQLLQHESSEHEYPDEHQLHGNK